MTTSTASAPRTYHYELDVLRCFGFLGVFCHHSFPHDPAFYTAMRLPAALARLIAGAGMAGALGVDLFFLLSAYLVTNSFLHEREKTGTLRVGAFYRRRALRIWPLYLFFLLLAESLTWLVSWQHIGWRAGLAFLFMVGNWWIIFVGFPSSVIFPLWAVSVEEQFYAVWPWLARKLSRRNLVVAAIVLLVVSNATRVYLGLHNTWEQRMWTNTLARLDPFAVGILLAIALGGKAPRFSRLARLGLLFAGLACYWLAANYWLIKMDPLTLTRVVIGYPVAALGACLLLLATLSDSAPFAPRPLVYLGKISYGLYVFHVVGLMVTDLTIHHQTSSFGRYVMRNSVALALAIVFATLSYYLLEKPFLRKKEKLAPAVQQ